MVHTTFLKEFKALQQKGRRIPIHIQEKVEQKIQSLIDQGTSLNWKNVVISSLLAL